MRRVADIPRMLQFAQHCAQTGQLPDAERTCRQILSEQPAQGDAAQLLGIVLLQRGDFAEGARWLEVAARAAPDIPEIHANLGHALRALGRIDEASAALERAIALRPAYPIALNNLGLVRRAQGRLDEAVALYRQALAHAPNLLPAHVNLGNALRDLGDAAGSVTAFRRALALAPQNPDARAGLAGSLESAGDDDAAINEYFAALQLNPRHVPALVNLALLLKKLNRVDESINFLRKAERANPQSPDVREKLGRSLFDAGYYDEAVDHFARAVAARPSPETRVNAATLVPPIYRSIDDVAAWRERLRREVATLRREGVAVDVTRSPARAPFYVPYAGLDDDRDVLREIALLHRPPADPPLTGRAWQGERKVRVGFVSSFFKDHTVGLWTRGIIEKLPRERFEVVVLSIGRHEDDVARFIRGHADTYVEVPPLMPAARELIGSLSLDVLVYADIGMEPVTYTLAFSRLAPVQCVMWGHPATSGIDTIDYYLSSELAEPDDAQRNYTEKLVRFKNLPLYYYRPPTW
jgi:predicted O-linked N-acetylglucosamine transferase (SPINDLY family)